MATGSRVRLVAAAAVLLFVTAALQWQSGAYASDLSSDSDEPAHVVSGLMVHDYAANLFKKAPRLLPLPPRAFAEAYYIHYPKVAIGHWPPLFYLIQASWMFVFGRTKSALLVLMMAVMAATAIIIWRQVRHETNSEVAAACAAVIFLILPVSQQALFGVMPDPLLALLTCAAILCVGDTLRKGSRAWAAFWVLASAAILLHARGAYLSLLPWLAVALAGRIERFRDWGLWLGGVLCLSLGIPWFLFVHQAAGPALASILTQAVAFPAHGFHELGFIPLAMTLVGVTTVPYRNQPYWAAVTAAVAAIWIFFSLAIVPWTSRYFLAVLPACILLMSGAWKWLATRISPVGGSSTRLAVGTIAILTAVPCALQGLPLLHKSDRAYEAVAERLMRGPDANSTVYLIAGDDRSEGAFVAATAFADDPGRHIVLRSSKVLAKSDWSGSYYLPLFSSSQQIATFLADSHISVIILQDGPLFRPDLTMLRAALRDTPAWVALPPSPHALLYRRDFPLPRGPLTIRLDMRESLKKFIEWTQ